MTLSFRGHALDDLPEESALLLFGVTTMTYYFAIVVSPHSALFAFELMMISAVAAILLFANAVPGGAE